MLLNYTPLRHKMLAAIARGEVSRGLGMDSYWIQAKPLPSSHGHCDRALSDLVRAGYWRSPSGADYRTPCELTETGKVQLADWSSKYGESS